MIRRRALDYRRRPSDRWLQIETPIESVLISDNYLGEFMAQVHFAEAAPLVADVNDSMILRMGGRLEVPGAIRPGGSSDGGDDVPGGDRERFAGGRRVVRAGAAAANGFACAARWVAEVSWCTVADIGDAASIRHVRIAQTVWESFVGKYALYAPSGSWFVQRYPHEDGAGEEWTVSLGFRCLEVSELKIWRHRMLRSTISSVEVAGRLGTFMVPPGLIASQPYDFQITGVRGTATLKDLSVGDDLVAGQSVLRAGAVVLIEEDETAEANDQLIVPPDILRSAALTVARRVIQMEQDQQAAYDDSTYGGGGVGNRLVDGWIEAVQEFLK